MKTRLKYKLRLKRRTNGYVKLTYGAGTGVWVAPYASVVYGGFATTSGTSTAYTPLAPSGLAGGSINLSVGSAPLTATVTPGSTLTVNTLNTLYDDAVKLMI